MLKVNPKGLPFPLACKEIQPVHPKGSVLNIHWKDRCWSWSSKTLATWCKELTHLKRPWWWEWLKIGGEADGSGWDGWMASPSQWTWVWVGSGSYDEQGSLVCCSPWGPKGWTQLSNWTELRSLRFLFYSSFMYSFHLFLISLLLLGLYYLCPLFVTILHEVFVEKKLSYEMFFSQKALLLFLLWRWFLYDWKLFSN